MIGVEDINIVLRIAEIIRENKSSPYGVLFSMFLFLGGNDEKEARKLAIKNLEKYPKIEKNLLDFCDSWINMKNNIESVVQNKEESLPQIRE